MSKDQDLLFLYLLAACCCSHSSHAAQRGASLANRAMSLGESMDPCNSLLTFLHPDLSAAGLNWSRRGICGGLKQCSMAMAANVCSSQHVIKLITTE